MLSYNYNYNYKLQKIYYRVMVNTSQDNIQTQGQYNERNEKDCYVEIPRPESDLPDSM